MNGSRILLMATAAAFLAGACGRTAFQGGGGAATSITLDSTGSNSISASGTTSLSLSGLVVGVGSNECLVASLALNNASASGITLTWDSGGNAQVLTEVVSQTSGTGAVLVLERLIAPHRGKRPLSASWSGTADAVLGAISFSGADQATCVGNAVHGSGNSASPSISVNATSGALTLGVSVTSSTLLSFNQTTQWNQALAAGTGGGAAFVQQALDGKNGNSLTVNLPGDVAAGDALIACLSFDDNQSGVNTVTGGGVTWTQAAVGPKRTAIWFGTGSTGANGAIQVNFNGSDNCGAHISEWSGILDGSPLDGTPAMAAGNNRTLATGTMATINADDLLFACAAQDQSTVGNPSAGFTALDSITGKSNDNGEEAWELVSSTGSWTNTWTMNTNSSESEAILAAFQTARTATAPLASGAGTAPGSATYTWATGASSAWAAAGLEILPQP